MITVVLMVLAAWLGFDLLFVVALVRRSNSPHVIRRREVRQLETLWSLS